MLVTGDGRPLTALRISEQSGRLQCEVAWENFDLSSYLSSMVAQDGYVYGMNDDGQWTCVRIDDGRTVWQEGNHGYYSTPLLADSQLLGLNELGELVVLAAERSSYRVLGQYELADCPTWTTPALVDGRLFVRSADSLCCFEVVVARASGEQ